MQEISNSLAFGRTLPLANRGLRTQRGLLSGVGATLSLLGQAIAAIRRNNGTALYVPDDYKGAFIDSTGTQPVTAIGDLVGLLTDRSYGAGNLGVELVNQSVIGTVVPASTEYIFPAPVPTGTVGKTYLVHIPSGMHISGPSTWIAPPVPGQPFYWVANTSGQFFVRNPTASAITLSFASVREVLGNHAVQPTTAAKPVVTRVPKRLGPNLVVNGDFSSGTTGWVALNSSLSTSAGELVVTHTSGGYSQGYASAPTTIGRTYLVTGNLRRGTETANAGLTAQDASGNSIATGVDTSSTALVPLRTTFIAVTTESRIVVFHNTGTPTGTIMADNITVQEVLEWTPALKFDGGNDLLTLSSGAILQQGSDHFVTVAGRLDAGAGGWRQIYGSRNAASGQAVVSINYNGVHNRLSVDWIDNTNASVSLSESVSSKGQFFVATAAKIGNTRSFWVNGVLQASSTVALGTTTVNVATIGASEEEGTVRNYWSGELIDIALGQSTLTEADRKTIERNMAQRAGVTYVD